jgi:hypothetical protein
MTLKERTLFQERESPVNQAPLEFVGDMLTAS